jgi:cytochrome c biogenesis protein CcdA
MVTLLLILTPVALLDSISMIPLCVAPLAAILGGSRPTLGAVSFSGGIFLVYLGSGFLLLLGLDTLFNALGSGVSRWLNQPNTLELLLQIAVGVVMVGFAWKLTKAREIHVDRGASGTISPSQGFVLGTVLTLVGLPGAFPYFGAIDQILRADLGYAGGGFALLFYNIVFLLPFVALLIVRFLFPTRSEEICQRVAFVVTHWGRKLIVALLVCLGIVFVADGIGWFVGQPLLPVG